MTKMSKASIRSDWLPDKYVMGDFLLGPKKNDLRTAKKESDAHRHVPVKQRLLSRLPSSIQQIYTERKVVQDQARKKKQADADFKAIETTLKNFWVLPQEDFPMTAVATVEQCSNVYIPKDKTPLTEKEWAEELIAESHGNFQSILNKIIGDRRAPDSGCESLRVLINHSQAFRAFLSIDVKNPHAKSGIGQMVAAPLFLAQVATAKVDVPTAAAALARLNDIARLVTDSDHPSLQLVETVADAFACLLQKLPEMNLQLANLAAQIISDKLAKFPASEKTRLLNLCASLPESVEEELADLRLAALNTPVESAPRHRGLSDYPALQKVDKNMHQVIDQALRRGIRVQIGPNTAPEDGKLIFERGGIIQLSAGSITFLTSEEARRRSSYKESVRGHLNTREFHSIQSKVSEPAEFHKDHSFLTINGRINILPMQDTRGMGIALGVRTKDELVAGLKDAGEAIEKSTYIPRPRPGKKTPEPKPWVTLESHHEGRQVRVSVINYKMVAAYERKPASVTGDGKLTLGQLIVAHNMKAEHDKQLSKIPENEELVASMVANRLAPETVIKAGEVVMLNKIGNTISGGTIREVSDELSPELRSKFERMALSLETPVVQLDIILPESEGRDNVVMDARESFKLGELDGHPASQYFVDALYPYSPQVS